MATVLDIYSKLNSIFPFSEQESWDNSGILVDGDKAVDKVLVALDATKQVVSEAEKVGAQLIVTHHPVIFYPLKSLSEDNPAVMALKKDIAIISAHTNFDVSDFGADAHLAELLSNEMGFICDGALDITQNNPSPHGFGRIGKLKKAVSAEEFAAGLKKILGCDALRCVSSDKQIEKIAFCCGAGGEYLEKAIALGCDAYITSDVKHSHFTRARDCGISLFVPTHYQMEKPAMKNIVALISENFKEIEIFESKKESNPSYII